MTTFDLWAMLAWRTPKHALFRYFTPSPIDRSESSRLLLRTVLALVGTALLGMLIADLASVYNLVRLENVARVMMLPGVMLLTLLGTAVIALVPVYMFGGVIVAGQHIGALQRSYRHAIRDDLTTMIPGGHPILLASLGAARYRHPNSFFGMGLYTAADLHLLGSLGVVGAYAFLLELSLGLAYQPLPVPSEVALLVHPQVILLCALVVMVLYVEVRQQLVLGFAAGIASIYALPNRILADISARLLVIVVTLASYSVAWAVFTTHPPLEILDTTRDRLAILIWGWQLVTGYGAVFLVREALIWGLWRGVRTWGRFPPGTKIDFANPHQK